MSTLAERIAHILALDPDAGAIEYDGRWTRWGEVAAIAETIDRIATDAGCGEGAAIGLLMHNRPALVGALLGVVGAERCAVTLSPHHGEARLADDLRKLALPIVVADASAWQDGPLRSACADAGTLGVAVGPEGAERVPGLEALGAGPHREAMPGVAVEMLTSGTTGAPKRVELRAAAIQQSLLGSKHYESKADGDAHPMTLRRGVAILSAPLVHVAGIFRSLQCVCDGRPFALMDRFAVEPWHALVVRHRPKTVSLVPAALRAVLDAELPRADLASIAAVVSGTAPLPPEHAEAFEAQYGIPVLVSYGATEFAGGVAGWSLGLHREFGAAKRGSVGRAHPGCALRVVEADSGRALDAGEVGLLEVRSSQLGREAGWVRTTDLAEIDEDGFLFIRGRADAAILRGGFKVLPDVVAGALGSHPAVHEAAVVGLPDARLGAVPVAAVELVPDVAVSEAELLQHARDHLARYEVPAAVRIMGALPRTPSLKISMGAVRERFERSAEHTAAR